MKKLIFIWALSLIVLSSVSVSAQNVSEDTSQIGKENLKPQEKSDVLKEIEKLRDDNYEKAMEGANRSIGLANFMIQIMIVAVAILGGLGVFSYFRQGQIRKRIEKESNEIQDLKEKTEDDFKQEFEKIVNLRCDIENIKTHSETTMKDIDRRYIEVSEIFEKIEKTGREIDKKERFIEESKIEISAISYFVQGWVLMELGKNEDAIDKFEKAIELKPDYSESYYGCGWALEELGNHEGAIEKFNEAIKQKPNYAEAYLGCGWALGELGKHIESIEMCKKAVEIKPNYLEAYINWGWSLGKLGKHEEEMEKYEKARELKPDNAIVWFNIACVYSLQNNKKGALENLKKAIELKPAFKENAKKDEYFKNLWEDEDFKRLVE
jgi:tetratricopeptide (TPR) repeat protein